MPRRRLDPADRPHTRKKSGSGRTGSGATRRSRRSRIRATVGGKLTDGTVSVRGWRSHLSAVLALEPFFLQLHFPSTGCDGTSVPVEAEGTSGWAGSSRRAGAQSWPPCGGGRRHRVAENRYYNIALTTDVKTKKTKKKESKYDLLVSKDVKNIHMTLIRTVKCSSQTIKDLIVFI